MFIEFLLTFVLVNSQQMCISHIPLTAKGTTFMPKNSMECPLDEILLSSSTSCAKYCFNNRFCRTFIYDEMTMNCQLYLSDLSAGNMIPTIATSQIGFIPYESNFFNGYNKTCNYCQTNRYLACQNSTCQCPFPYTFWNGSICENKFYFGQTCNSTTQCRQDLNLSCIFNSCQLNTAICQLNSTGIIFDDLPNINNTQGLIPSVFKDLLWTNMHYLNSSIHPTSGYPILRGFGQYVGWFSTNAAIETLIPNNTITLNSCLFVAGWSNLLNVTINGYFNGQLLNTTRISLNTYTQKLVIFNWYGLNKIAFIPSGPSYLDTGIDNLCITF